MTDEVNTILRNLLKFFILFTSFLHFLKTGKQGRSKVSKVRTQDKEARYSKDEER